MLEVFYTRDLSSGTVHERVRRRGRALTDEGCNLDQAGEYEIVPLEDALASMDKCANCFGPSAEQPEDESTEGERSQE